MTEAAFWNTFREHMRPYGTFKRIENRLDKGTPDVAYCCTFLRSRGASGWIELKYLARWPVKFTSPVVIDHLTLEQILWLEEWAERCGRAWLIIRIDDSVLALTPAVARLLQRRQLVTHQIIAGATGCWPVSPFPVRGLLEVLTA